MQNTEYASSHSSFISITNNDNMCFSLRKRRVVKEDITILANILNNQKALGGYLSCMYF